MIEWISVDDKRKPREIIDFVLVARKEGEAVSSVMEANYQDGKFIVHRFGIMKEFKSPTHWAELPSPPKDNK